MSRTYRDTPESFDAYWWRGFDWYLEMLNKTEKQMRAQWKYKPVRGYQHWSLPHEFRNSVNRRRRARDKQEIYREVTYEDHEGLYDPWNCKTANEWGYY